MAKFYQPVKILQVEWIYKMPGVNCVSGELSK